MNTFEKIPTMYGENPILDAIFEELMVIENLEIDAISYDRLDLLPSIRESMIPIKARINEIEGFIIYPEAI